MFTFKNNKRTSGAAGVGEGESCEIKIKKKECGIISGGHWNSGNGYRISFTVKDDTQISGFRWITLKHRPETFDTAKEWVKEHYDVITAKYDVHFFRD